MRRPAECGTDGGYYRHRRILGDQPCDACRAAHTAHELDRLARRRVTPIQRVGSRLQGYNEVMTSRAQRVAFLRAEGIIP